MFVKRLLSTTAVYSSGPVTLLMQKAPLAPGEIAQREPHTGRLHHDVDATAEQEVLVERRQGCWIRVSPSIATSARSQKASWCSRCSSNSRILPSVAFTMVWPVLAKP
jgi:hypothetical protein